MDPLQNLSDDELLRLAGRALAMPDAPTAWIERAAALGAAEVRSSPWKQAAQGALHRIAAVLSFDSLCSPPTALGLRAISGRGRHLLFNASGRDIDLRITPLAERFVVAGQVLGSDDAGMVEIVNRSTAILGGTESHVVPLDALGEFRFAGVRAGVLEISVRMGRDHVCLPALEVDAQDVG